METIVQLVEQDETGNFANKEDFAILNRQRAEFEAESATLRGRVNALETRRAKIESNQFAPTTKLNRETILKPSVTSKLVIKNYRANV